MTLLQHLWRRNFTLMIFGSALFASAIAITNVFPYAPAMVGFMGLTEDKRELGYYAGYLMTAYQVGQVLTSYHLGIASDKYGRKRVILLGLASCTLPQIAFGLSHSSFVYAIAMRFLMGVFNGVVAAAKAMAPELVPAHRQPFAMSLIAAMWGLGNIMGASIGGLLAERGGDGGLLGYFPYLLPNLVCAVIAMGTILAVYKYLPETTGKHRTTRSLSAMDSAAEDHVSSSSSSGSSSGSGGGGGDGSSSSSSSSGSGSAGNGDAAAEPSEPAEAAAVASVGKKRCFCCSSCGAPAPREAVAPLVAYSLVAFTSIMFDEVFPLWCAAPEASGGLGVETQTIGALLTASGAALISFQLFVLPWVSSYVALDRLFKMSCFLGSAVFIVFPLVAQVAPPARWPVLLLAIVLYRCANAGSFTCIFVLINNSVHPKDRGRVQGLAMAMAATMRAMGPVISAVLFAWSLTNEIHIPWLLDVHFVFTLCGLCMAATGTFAVCCLHARYNTAQHLRGAARPPARTAPTTTRTAEDEAATNVAAVELTPAMAVAP